MQGRSRKPGTSGVGVGYAVNQFERIKQMSVDEMAQFMFDMVDCVSCTNKLQRSNEKCHGDGRKCLKVTKEWLNSKVSV